MNQSTIDALLDGPALAPPPGVTPNFVNPANLSHPELAVLQLTLATLVVWMRIYTKLRVLKRMLAEDYWLITAWVAFVGFHGLVFLLEALPYGIHQWDLTARKAIEHAKP
ncbi:hypothetical protein OPT61_g9993 [Boeremia exigua]|uniref:Uncharacterized protein n=1 Tax=Boeremia exigua TaxID=749465 RepID=A0ACC2HSK0_9PLEO|nr:hypothetical protein OPT61_g9993 [Boeremia exigua]